MVVVLFVCLVYVRLCGSLFCSFDCVFVRLFVSVSFVVCLRGCVFVCLFACLRVSLCLFICLCARSFVCLFVCVFVFVR